VIAEDAVPADHLGVGARVGQGVRRHASGRPERHAGGPGEELAHRHHRARTRSPRRLNMADAHTGASAERFEVRVTADSHFAWLRTRLALERTIMCLSAPRWDPTHNSNFRFPERSVKRQGRARGRSRILFLVRLSPVRLSGNCLCWHQTRKT
jgi:hypothetical protein